MQDVIEELIRGIGYGVLRLVTWGRYRGGRPTDRLFEGALGLGLILASAFVVYGLGMR